MQHPHQSFLDEFKIAIDRFVPMTPPEIVEEAKAALAALEADTNASEAQIREAFASIGKKEYPYRKAYEALCSDDEEARLQEVVLERLEGDVKQKIADIAASGVVLEDYVKSPLFEKDLSGEERYQVEKAILMADDVLEHQCDERANRRREKYEDLVKKFEEEAVRLQALIDQLKETARKNPHQTEDILAAVARLEEGWSITSPDPTEQDIQKEIEYWKTVISEGKGE